MKKILLIIVVLGVIVGGIWYAQKTRGVPADPNIATYKNSSLGISFTYPKILSANTINGVITLHHEVPFTHHDYCDFKGEGDTTINTLTDFNVTFHISDKNLVDTMKTESPYIPEENFVNGNVVASPGFIDSYTSGGFSGYAIFEGAEGCGFTTYYFPVSSDKTLVVRQDFITVFTGAIDVENMKAAEAVPGVINRETEKSYLESIFKTLKIQ
ncbi:MAG TPA: hypothetical protein VJG67_03920 [Candidatus Paceibacterota bacterium]